MRFCKPSLVFGYSAEEAAKPEVDGSTGVGATCEFRDADLVQETNHKTAQARKSRPVLLCDIRIQTLQKVLFWNARMYVHCGRMSRL
jgi:hypothetical protein